MSVTVARSPSTHVAEGQRTWGTFEDDRASLYDQYLDVPYAAETGLDPEVLESEIARCLAGLADRSHALQKAHAFRLILTRAQIHVDPFDWFPDKFNHAGLLHALRRRWHDEARAGALAADAAWFETLHATGLGRGGLDTGHISPGWGRIFSLGLEGIAAEAQRYLAGCAADERERRDFYAAVVTVCQAAIALSHRFADLAEALVPRFPDRAQRLRMIAATCRRVPARPPETLQQALYFAWLMHELIEFEGEAVRSLGRFDQMFLPYYRADLTAGRLTREQAKELFKVYWMKSYARTRGSENGAHFALGGQCADGSDAANELTGLILEAYEDLNTPDPKLSVRFYSGSPDWLYQRTLDMIRHGHNAMVLMNDEVAVPALQKRGKAVEDARCYLPIGCYEPAVDGKEAACTTNLVVNLAKGIELALHDGVDPLTGRQVGPPTGDPRYLTSFSSFQAAYLAQLDAMLDRSAAAIGGHERCWSQINPSPLIASTIEGCLPRGRDIGDGGCQYNAVGCVGVGLANAADSLLAVRRAVYEEQRCTLDELIAALRANFEGYEPLREYLINRIPKWGNGDPEADRLAIEVADHYCAKIHSFTNERGGPYQAALYSFTFQWPLGESTGALPDGKLAHKPLAPGVGAMAGRDRLGVTALLESVRQIDFTETPNGSVLDIRLHPSAVAGTAGLDAMVALVKTFFAQGVFAVQFNVVDAGTLRAAQRDPASYATLQVRVAGYSAYFVNLSRDVQDHLIAQNAHHL
jgi:pyruvate formate-lyase/glycerol dehydratase family glycyl radical enzyme